MYACRRGEANGIEPDVRGRGGRGTRHERGAHGDPLQRQCEHWEPGARASHADAAAGSAGGRPAVRVESLGPVELLGPAGGAALGRHPGADGGGGERVKVVVVRILGIESSCDETAAAVVEQGPGGEGAVIRASVVAS